MVSEALCRWLSCQIVLSDLGFILRTALCGVKMMVSGDCRSHDLIALDLEEDSLKDELLGVMYPLLSLCCVGCGEEYHEWSCHAYPRCQGMHRASRLIVPLRLGGVAESYSHQKE